MNKYQSANRIVWNTPYIDTEKFHNYTFVEQTEYLITLAHFAPSSHNTQPWRFKIDETQKKISVFLDLNSVLLESDKKGRQAIVSIGCSIENIVTACEHYGISYKLNINTEIEINSSKQYIEIATIHFLNEGKSPSVGKKRMDSIWKRKAIRSEFDPTQKIPNNLLVQLENTVDDSSIEIKLISDRLRQVSIAEFQKQADSFVINSKKFSTELGAWLLPNDTTSYLGMPGYGFGLQDDQAIRLHKALSGEIQMEPEDGLRFALGGKKALESAALIAAILVDKDTPCNWVKVGMTLQKNLLLLTEHDFQFSIHAGITEVTLINKMFSLSLGTKKRITALFRAGKVIENKKLEAAHTPRLPIKDILI